MGAAGLSDQRTEQAQLAGAFLFAMAVAVGLTPEMLPMIVTVNLSRAPSPWHARKSSSSA